MPIQNDSRLSSPVCRALALVAFALASLALSACNRQSPERPATSGAATPSSGTSGTAGTSSGSAAQPADTGTSTNSGALSSGSSGSTSPVGDTAVTAKVKAALLADSDLKSVGITVDTTEGVVTLSGAVSNQAQIERAAQVASNVGGVRGVKNSLAIKR